MTVTQMIADRVQQNINLGLHNNPLYHEIAMTKDDAIFMFNCLHNEGHPISTVQQYIYLNQIEPLFLHGFFVRIVE